jgi:hypothetical protein
MCADPHHEYLMAKKWHDEHEAEDVEELNSLNNDEPVEIDSTSQIEA